MLVKADAAFRNASAGLIKSCLAYQAALRDGQVL
jgi:hypothetical protein